MSTILLDDAEIGATLTSDVTDRQGRVLLKTGVELNEKHIRTLQTWGVLEIDIEGTGNQTQISDQYPQDWLDEADKLAQEHFQHCRLDHPVVEALLDYWKIRHLKQRNAQHG